MGSRKDWISVKDRLPSKEECEKDHGWFIVFRPDLQDRAGMSRYDGHEKEQNYEHNWRLLIDRDITHWMPLPEIPKKD